MHIHVHIRIRMHSRIHIRMHSRIHIRTQVETVACAKKIDSKIVQVETAVNDLVDMITSDYNDEGVCVCVCVRACVYVWVCACV